MDRDVGKGRGAVTGASRAHPPVAALLASASDYPACRGASIFWHRATELSGALRFSNVFGWWLSPRRSLMPVFGCRYTWRDEGLGNEITIWWLVDLRVNW